MSTLNSIIRLAPKRFTAAVLMVAAAIIIPTAAFAWGPERDTYTIKDPAPHVTFNSITDNPAHGDERNFVQVKESTASDSTYTDNLALTPGKDYTVFMYYHNDASSSLNASGKGIATGAYAKAAIPALVNSKSTGTAAKGYIGATNATPKEVYDDVTFSNATDGDIALRYIDGSAKIYNKGKLNGTKLSDKIISTGTPIGYDTLGKIPGCNDYSGYITFKITADQANFELKKEVRVAGSTEWKDSVNATPGSTVEYQLTYKNTGTTKQNNVVLKDTLPANLEYTKDSSFLKNVSNPTPKLLSNNLTTSTGVNIGNYDPNSVAYVKFSAKVNSKEELFCKPTTLRNVARAETNNGTKQDTADVIVKSSKPCAPVVKDIQVCELATKKIISIKETAFDAKKHSKNLADCKVPNKIDVCELATKTIIKINESDFDASKHSKTLSDCDVPPVTPPTTPPVEELPHTGMTENIVAVIGLGALIASVTYYVASRRALNQ